MSSLRTMVVLGVAALAAGCATTGGVPKPFPSPARHSTGAPPAATTDAAVGVADAYALTATALSFRGTPYRNGGSDPTGFDCSGFTQYVFNQHGVKLPREVKDQFGVGTTVPINEVAAGDLLFFATTGPAGASHVGIAIDSDEFVHAPSSTGVVRVERLSQSYWSQRFVGARRVN